MDSLKQHTKIRFQPMNGEEWDKAQKRRADELNRKKEAQENEKLTVRARIPERPKRVAGSLNEEEGSHIPGQSKWTPAVKTAHHYQGQINGKTFAVPHASLNIYRKGGYAEPMRHSIVTSLHHVQHNNPDLTPEEHARVHEHIKAIHGGQESAHLKEDHQIGNTVHYRLGAEGHLRIGKIVRLEKDHVVVKRGGFNYKVPHKTIVNSEKLEEAAIKVTTTPATRKEIKGARPMRPGAAERFMRRFAGETELEKKEKLSESHTMEDGSYRVGTKVTVDGKHGEINYVHHSPEHPKYPHSYKITDLAANDPYKSTRLRGNTFISHNDVKVHHKELTEGTHVEYIKKHKPARPCTAHDITFGGQCLNCGHPGTTDPKNDGYRPALKKESKDHGSNFIDKERTDAKTSRRQRFAAASKEKREKEEHKEKQLQEAAPFMTTYKRNESANRHTTNIVHLAKHFGDEADQAEAKFYHDELKKHGHNKHHEAQYALHTKLWPKAIAAHTYKENVEMEKSQLVNEETHAYDVHHNGKHIDTIFYGHNEPVEEVKRSLVNHDGYHPDITVRKQRKNQTGRAPVKESSTLKTVRNVLAEMSTRKNFQMVADLIKANPDAKKRQELANHHASVFAKENPRFDHARFHAAAGTVHGK